MTQTLFIDRLSDDGRGVARHEGKVCFVAGALPGETVVAKRVRRAARHDDYELVSIEQAATARTSPPCPIYGHCGGCQLQHFDTAAQLEHKQQALLAMLSHHAKLEPGEIDEPLLSRPYGYRRRARLALDLRGEKPIVGFRSGGDTSIVDVSECSVLAPPLDALLRPLSELLGSLSAAQHLGHVELSISDDTATRYAVIGVRVVGDLPDSDETALVAFAQAQDAYLVLLGNDGGIRPMYSPSPTPIGYPLPDFDLRLAFQPGDFIQGNAAVNEALVGRVVEWLRADSGAAVLDAFCGLGNFSLALGRRGAQVLGLEVDAAMVARGEHNASVNRVVAEFAVRDLQDHHLTLPGRDFAGVVLDPPRTGAAKLIERIARARIPRVVYVSCSPGTFTRDAAVLAAAGYRLDRLAIVDMFPQTTHSESIALFGLKGTPR